MSSAVQRQQPDDLNYLLGLSDKQLADLMAQLKKHPKATEYQNHVINVHGAEDDYTFGDPDNDTVLEIQDFVGFLKSLNIFLRIRDFKARL